MTGEVILFSADIERRHRGDYAEQTRQVLLATVAKVKRMSLAECRAGKNFKTEDAASAHLTVTMSLREVYSLLRVLGPIGLQNGDGSYTRLFAAMHVCQKHLVRAPDGKSLGVVAALQVLQVAINDHLWHCRDVPQPARAARVPRRWPR